MNRDIYFRPLIPLLLSMIAGISCGLRFPWHSVWAYLAVTCCTGVLLIKIIRKKSALFLPLFLFFSLGYISIQPWFPEKLPASHIVNFTDTGSLNISGQVIESPEIRNKKLTFVLLAETVENDGKVIPVSGKISVKVLNNIPGISIGDKVYFKSGIRSIRNFNNPGGFDFKRYMAFNGITGTAYVAGEKIRVEHNEENIEWKRLIENARKKFALLIENSAPSDEAGVLKALVIGDQNSISPEIREDFNRTGTSHILSISGLHVGIVATVSFLFFNKFLSYFNLFLWNAWTRKGAAILSLLPVIIYGLLAGMSPSTQRSVIMVSVFLMSFFVEREQDGINTLAVAAMLILAFHPPSLFLISFQLSFLSVWFIITGMNLTLYRKDGKSKAEEGWRFRIQRQTSAFFLVSFFATIGTFPVVMYYFNQVSLVGLAANCVAVPLIGFAVVSAGLLSFFIYPVSSLLSVWLIKASSAVLGISLEFINYFAKLPFAAIKTVTPSFFEICWYYLLLGTVFVILKGENRKIGREREGSVFERIKQRAPFIAIVLLIIAGYADVWYWLDKRFLHEDLRVTVIDVGQGTSALLELPGGYNVLVDGGGFSDNSIFDVGERITAPFLWRNKIKSVDTLVLSHPNSDHLNGLLYIAENFNVKEFWSNGEAVDTLGYKRLIEIIKEKNIKMEDFRKIGRNRVINGTEFKILYPEPGFKDKKEKWRKGDNSSLVLKAVFGSKSFLFTGDIKAKGESDIVKMSGNRLKSTVLVVPHHGSKSSSTDIFIDKIDPEIAVIPVGWKNRYKFPAPEVLERYKARRCRILRTDENGAVMMSTDGKSLIVITAVGKEKS
ncbi:MAG: DNA internalization-related competence protein ComEC/Rec2 [Desulfobacterales bacterium]|nr:DNA internalization-related competence protein ComEC/Rec2 [Desulfobacterales bacterium]